MPGDLCTAPRIISLSPLSLATYSRGKWPLVRNPDRSWWHRHTSLKLFWPQPPWFHGQQGTLFFVYRVSLFYSFLRLKLNFIFILHLGMLHPKEILHPMFLCILFCVVSLIMLLPTPSIHCFLGFPFLPPLSISHSSIISFSSHPLQMSKPSQSPFF